MKKIVCLFGVVIAMMLGMMSALAENPFCEPIVYDDYLSKTVDKNEIGDLLKIEGKIVEGTVRDSSEGESLDKDAWYMKIKDANGKKWYVRYMRVELDAGELLTIAPVGETYDRAKGYAGEAYLNKSVVVYGEYRGYSKGLKGPVVDVTLYGGMDVPEDCVFLTTIPSVYFMKNGWTDSDAQRPYKALDEDTMKEFGITDKLLKGWKTYNKFSPSKPIYTSDKGETEFSVTGPNGNLR